MIRILAAYCCIGPTRSMGCVSRCVCVCGTKYKPYKNGWKVSDAVWQQARVSPVNHVLDGGAHWRHLANTMDRSLQGAAILAVATITAATCRYHLTLAPTGEYDWMIPCDAALCQITFTTCCVYVRGLQNIYTKTRAGLASLRSPEGDGCGVASPTEASRRSGLKCVIRPRPFSGDATLRDGRSLLPDWADTNSSSCQTTAAP